MSTARLQRNCCHAKALRTCCSMVHAKGCQQAPAFGEAIRQDGHSVDVQIGSDWATPVQQKISYMGNLGLRPW